MKESQWKVCDIVEDGFSIKHKKKWVNAKKNSNIKISISFWACINPLKMIIKGEDVAVDISVILSNDWKQKQSFLESLKNTPGKALRGFEISDKLEEKDDNWVLSKTVTLSKLPDDEDGFLKNINDVLQEFLEIEDIIEETYRSVSIRHR